MLLAVILTLVILDFVILMLVILDFVILTLKAEGSSKVLVMKYNWMLRCAQHDEIRTAAFGVMARRAYNTKGLPVEYNRKSEGWDWVFL